MPDGLIAQAYNAASAEALRIYAEVLAGVRADKLMADSVRRVDAILEIQDKRLDLSTFADVYICGAGKASFAMAQILREIVGPYVSGGLVVTKHGHGGEIPGVRVLEASHPVPDESSLEAGRQMLAMAAETGPNDLVLFCLSGGASALMESLKEGITLNDLQELNRKMLAQGKAIHEINQARSKLSRIKAGGLAQAFSTATVAVLVLSDVGTELGTIGSGPFWGQDSDEWVLLGSGNYWDLGEERAYRHHRCRSAGASERETYGNIRRQLAGAKREPQGAAPAQPRRVFHRFIGSLHTAMGIAMRAAGEHLKLLLTGPEETLLYQGERLKASRESPRSHPMMFGDVRHEAARIAEVALTLRPGECRLYFGEPTVTIRGDGKGGRCQELACAAADLIAGRRDLAILAGSTDGTDGPTDVGGAVVDGDSSARAAANGVTAEAALANSDSFRFLEACGGLIYTGPTQSNVNDIVIAVRL